MAKVFAMHVDTKVTTNIRSNDISKLNTCNYPIHAITAQKSAIPNSICYDISEKIIVNFADYETSFAFSLQILMMQPRQQWKYSYARIKTDYIAQLAITQLTIPLVSKDTLKPGTWKGPIFANIVLKCPIPGITSWDICLQSINFNIEEIEIQNNKIVPELTWFVRVSSKASNPKGFLCLGTDTMWFTIRIPKVSLM